jgi:hypothetical protein
MNTKSIIMVLALAVMADAEAWDNGYQNTNPYQGNQSPQLYSADGHYLGNVNTNQFDPNSINNQFGRYGSQFSPDSVNNQFGKYGSPYSPYSVRNPYAH